MKSMFDYFCIDNKWIPEDKQMPYEKQDYQTKSFDCELDIYEVLEDGRLIRGRENLCHVNFTGEIYFYTDNAEFTARCVNGVVKEVADVSIE